MPFLFFFFLYATAIIPFLFNHLYTVVVYPGGLYIGAGNFCFAVETNHKRAPQGLERELEHMNVNSLLGLSITFTPAFPFVILLLNLFIAYTLGYGNEQ